MTVRERIVEEALSWELTPYVHRQRCKGFGTDCIQFLIGVCLNTGVLKEEPKTPYYSVQWHLHQKRELLLETAIELGCIEKKREELLPGDFFLMKIGHVCSHSGIYLPNNEMIHALCQYPSKVIRRPFDGVWARTAKRFFAFPNVPVYENV